MLGYPVLSIRSIPKDAEYLARYFKDELDAGRIKTPLEINDVWPENYSANSAQKVWAAKFAARHPNVVRARPVVASSAATTRRPTASSTASSSRAQTPYSALHDIDANKPGGSIKIRVKTYAHSLRLHEERLEDVRRARTSCCTGSTTSGSSCCGSRREQLAARSHKDRRARAADPGD